MVFPFGMYGAATYGMRAATELSTFGWLPQLALAIALLAWTATALGPTTKEHERFTAACRQRVTSP